MPHDPLRRSVFEVIEDGLTRWVEGVGGGEEEGEDEGETRLKPGEGGSFFPESVGTEDVDVGEEVEGC